MVTLIGLSFFTGTLTLFIPIKEKTKVGEEVEAGIEIAYIPSASVATPVVVPLIMTVTPGRGYLFLSSTAPLTVRAGPAGTFGDC